MKHYDIIIFDLDGVIIDQRIGIIDSVKYALLKFGIDEKDKGILLSFIGPPLKKSFMEVYGFDEEKAIKAVEYYREIYKEKGIYEFSVYQGIEPMLSALNKRGKKLFLATTKPKMFADIVLKHANLYSFFNSVYGDTLTFDVTKTLMLKKILTDLGENDALNVVMVGDRDSDISAAKNNNIDSIGVTYGFGSYEELSKAGAKHIVKDVKELSVILLA